ncbi:MAG: hypothetical protein HY303_21475 [Candidatus Wallbacteria bacterium]|nr:hypothetical protein [Candidatus Wallbacteria bacterium]
MKVLSKLAAGLRGGGPRAGVGALPVIVMTLLMVLAFVGFSQRYFGSQVSSQTFRLAMGRLAEQLADSAVEEALHDVRSHVNDPSDPLFQEIRLEVYAGVTGEVPLTIKTPFVERIAREAPYRGFFLEDVRADVIWQAQFSKLPYEKFGVVRCRARAGIRLGLTEKVQRTVETGVDFKIVLASTPRPFDQTTVYIEDGTSLGTSRANRRMEEALRTLEALASEKADVSRRLEARKAEVSPGGSGEALLADYSSLDIPALRPTLHRMEEENLVVFRVQDQVDLKELDMAGAVVRFESDLESVDRRLSSARTALDAAFTDATRHREYLAALKDAAGKRTRFLQWLVGYQSATSEWGGEAWSRLAEFHYKLEQVEWKRKAFHFIREGQGGSARAQLEALAARLGRLNGVVFVENPGETLELEGKLAELRGMLVLVTTGAVRLSGAGRNGGPTDFLTIVSYGRMSVDGEVHASLIPRGGVLVPASATVKGNLILHDAQDPSALQGIVKHDARYFSGRTTTEDSSGAFTDYYLCALGPRPVYREVQR